MTGRGRRARPRRVADGPLAAPPCARPGSARWARIFARNASPIAVRNLSSCSAYPSTALRGRACGLAYEGEDLDELVEPQRLVASQLGDHRGDQSLVGARAGGGVAQGDMIGPDFRRPDPRALDGACDRIVVRALGLADIREEEDAARVVVRIERCAEQLAERERVLVRRRPFEPVHGVQQRRVTAVLDVVLGTKPRARRTEARDDAARRRRSIPMGGDPEFVLSRLRRGPPDGSQPGSIFRILFTQS